MSFRHHRCFVTPTIFSRLEDRVSSDVSGTGKKRLRGNLNLPRYHDIVGGSLTLGNLIITTVGSTIYRRERFF